MVIFPARRSLKSGWLGVSSSWRSPRDSFQRMRRSAPQDCSITRIIATSTCLILSGCVSQPREVAALDNCLTAEPAGWVSLSKPPQDAPALESLAKSTLANPPRFVNDRWYASGGKLLYCRRQDWCVAETWEFTRPAGVWELVDQHSWVCVTTHDRAFEADGYAANRESTDQHPAP